MFFRRLSFFDLHFTAKDWALIAINGAIDVAVVWWLTH